MFKLSSGFKAGLRALTILAGKSGSGPVPISEIAPELNLSDKYLEQLLMALKRAGLVRSSRGANGGFVLARAAAKITLLDIMTALQGPIAFCDCEVTSCPDCIRPEIWEALELCIGATLSTITLQHLVSTEPFQVMAHSIVLPDSPLWQDGAGI